MRAVSPPKSLVLFCAALLIVGVVMVIPSPAADAAPPLCDGKPATIVGTEGDDDLRGTNGDDVIVGLGGHDLIKGRGGNDTLCGNGGRDTLVGGPGDDVLRGGNGYDWVGYGLAPIGVTVDLDSGVATGWGTDQLGSIESVLGSAFDDHLIGNSGRNTCGAVTVMISSSVGAAPTTFVATPATTTSEATAGEILWTGTTGTTLSTAATATTWSEASTVTIR